MQSKNEPDQVLEMLRNEIADLQRKMSSVEQKLDAVQNSINENHSMLSSVIETMQQLGVVSQPYRKAGSAERSLNDRAYS